MGRVPKSLGHLSLVTGSACYLAGLGLEVATARLVSPWQPVIMLLETSPSWSANYIANVPSVAVPCGRKPAAVEGSQGCYSAPPSLLSVFPNPESSYNFCKKAFTGRQKRHKKDFRTHRGPTTQCSVSHGCSPALPLSHILCPERVRGDSEPILAL